MNIAQALKEKNRLASEVKELHIKMMNNVSVLAQNKFNYDTKETIEQYIGAVGKLISLKCAIQKANEPIREKIYSLSEAKTLLSYLKQIKNSIQNGFSSGHYREAPVEWKSNISHEEIDMKIEHGKKRIETLQDEIDAFNATTKVDYVK